MATIKGLTLAINGEVTGLNKALNEVNSKSRDLQKELKDVERLLKFDPSNTELLAQKQKILAGSIESTSEKLKTLKTASEQAQKQLANGDIGEEQYRALEREIARTEQSLARLTDQQNAANGIMTDAEKAAQAEAEALEESARETDRLKQEQEHLASQVSRTSDKLNKSSEALNSVNKSALIAAAALGALALVSTKVGMDFEAQMSKVEAISGATAEGMQALEDTAKEMGETTKFSATESGRALEYMAMAGWKTDQMIGGLPGIMNLAAASGEELALVSDIVTDALTAFGLQASDSAHFADVLAKASSSSNTNVAIMGATFKAAAPVAGALGYNIEDVAVAIGLMANAGIKGESAGTALRGVLTNIAKPTAMTKKYIEELGVTLTDATGEMKPLSDLLVDLRGKFSGLTEAQKAQYAAGIAGKESMSGLLALVNASETDFDKLTDAIADSNGTAKDMAETMEKNLKGQLTLLKSAAEGVGIAFSEKFDKQATGAVENLAKSVGNFSRDLSNGDLDGKIAAFGAAAAGAGVALVALNAALAAKDLMNFTKAARAGGTALEAYTSATKAGAIAQGALNLAQSLSPMGWLAIAAGAAATAFITYKAMTHEATSESELLRAGIKELNTELETQATNQDNLAEARSDSFGDIEKETNLVNGYVDELKGLTDANGKVVSGYEDRASYLSEQINNLIPNAVSASEDEAGAYYDLADSIDSMLFAKKKEMLLAAWEVEYKDALKNRAAAQDKVRIAAENQANAQDALDKLRIDSLTAVGREEDVYNLKIEKAQKVLEGCTQATGEARDGVETYQSTINSFNTALAAENVDDLNTAIAGLSGTLVKATGDNKAELEKAVMDAKTNLDILAATHAKNWESMTEIERREAKNQSDELKALLDTQATEARRGGVQLPENFGIGVTEGSPALSAAMNDMIASEHKTLEAAGVKLVDVGYGHTLMFNQGIGSGLAGVKTAGEGIGEAAADGAESNPSKPFSIGQFFAQGFADGVKNKSLHNGPVWISTAKMVEVAAKAAEVTGEINSPSRVMKRIGNFFAEGFAVGISNGKRDVADCSASVAQAALDSAKKVVSSNIGSAAFMDRVGKTMVMKLDESIKDNGKKVIKTAGELSKHILSEATKWVGDKKFYNELSLNDELAFWEDLKSIAGLQADELSDIDKKIYTNKRALMAQEKAAVDEFEKNVSTRADSLRNYAGIFDEIKEKADVSGQDLLQNLRDQVTEFESWQANMADLKDKGISGALLEELQGMGPKAASEIKAMTTLSEKELGEYVSLFQRKAKDANEQALSEMSPFYASLNSMGDMGGMATTLERNINYAVAPVTEYVQPKESNIAEIVGQALLAGLTQIGDSIFDAIPKEAAFNVDSREYARATWGAFDEEGQRRTRMYAPTREQIASIAMSVMPKPL